MGSIGFERKHKVHEAKINIEQLLDKIDDTKEKLQLLLENNYVNYSVLSQNRNSIATGESGKITI
jgi:hypothetical protein